MEKLRRSPCRVSSSGRYVGEDEASSVGAELYLAGEALHSAVVGTWQRETLAAELYAATLVVVHGLLRPAPTSTSVLGSELARVSIEIADAPQASQYGDDLPPVWQLPRVRTVEAIVCPHAAEFSLKAVLRAR